MQRDVEFTFWGVAASAIWKEGFSIPTPGVALYLQGGFDDLGIRASLL